MAAKHRAAKAGNAARAARNNPYLQRIVADEDLRDNLRTAFESARGAYGRMANGKAPTKALMEDKKLQKELRQAAQALTEAGNALRQAPRKQRRRRGGLRRLVLLTVVGGALAIALSEGLRSKVLDALFGSEEEFDYTSTTAPATPSPEPVSTS
jgi:ferric-dicitrate binding protein FerR (iron transport regulator)